MQTLEWDVADRMRKALRVSGVGVGEMADYLGVARNSVSNWINGHNPPSRQTLRLWALRTGTSLDWLEKGVSTPAGPDGPDGGNAITPRQHTIPRRKVSDLSRSPKLAQRWERGEVHLPLTA